MVLDNGRSPSVGSFRRQIQIGDINLLGYGDSISGIYTNTDGSNAFDFNYTLPINPRNGTISLSYGTSDNNVIEEPFDTLDIQSNSRYYEATFRQPIVETPEREFALGITLSRRESEAVLFNNSADESPFVSSVLMKKEKQELVQFVFFKIGHFAIASKYLPCALNLVLELIGSIPLSTKHPPIATFMLGGDKRNGYVY